MKTFHQRRIVSNSPRRQQGFTLIELSVVAIILVVLGVLALPKIRELIISGRVSTAGQDLNRGVVQLKQVKAMTPSATPYATLPTADKLFASTSFTLNGTDVEHELGVTGGKVVFTSLASGAAMAITVWGLNPAACPGLAHTLSRTADAVEIGQAGTVATPAAPSAASAVPTTISTSVVKVATTNYDAAAATNACSTDGENNFMRFYFS